MPNRNDHEFTIVEGVKFEPVMTAEEYDAFRDFWYKEVLPELLTLEKLIFRLF